MMRWPPRLPADEFPEGAQLFDSPMRRITGDHGSVQGPDRNARDPIRMNASLRQTLVDARLIGPERAATCSTSAVTA